MNARTSVARLADPQGESAALSDAAAVFASIAGAQSWSVLGLGDPEAAALLRDVRLRGETLPALVAMPSRRGVLYVALGRLEGPFAALRLERDARGAFAAGRIAETRRFLDEHGSALTHWVVEGDVPRWTRSNRAVSFVVDGLLRPVLYEDRAADGSPLAVLYGPSNGASPPHLERAIAKLVADLRAASEVHTATRLLPFAEVRVTRLFGAAEPLFLVAVEPVRRRSGVVHAMNRYGLSRREGQVLAEALRGASSPEIAQRLSISSSTATFHLKALLRKTGARNRTELTTRVLGWEDDAS